MKLMKAPDWTVKTLTGLMSVLLSAWIFALASVAMAAAPENQGVGTVPRFISGIMDGRFTFEQWGEEWWEIDTLGDVVGTLRHLGLAQMYTRHTPNLDGTLSNGEFTIVAANGDEIRGTYTGAGEWISDTEVLGAATFLIVEGTGRFTEVSGTINVAFLETFDDPTWASAKVTWTLQGMVSY
jgi:hypothetical protein